MTGSEPTITRKSLTSQFLTLISIFLACFVVGTVIFTYYQFEISNRFLSEREHIRQRGHLAREIDHTFTSVIFDIRGYFAYGNEELKENALAKEIDVIDLTRQLEKVALTATDQKQMKELRSFTDYYFNKILPKALSYFESGQIEELANLARSGATERTNEFLLLSEQYQLAIEDELDQETRKFKEALRLLQFLFLGFFALLLLILMTIIRLMLKNIGRPLTQLALTAKGITEGEDYDIPLQVDTSYEVHTLAASLNKMVHAIRDKEQDLLAQNQKLIAQQDELYAQASELQDTLVRLTESKQRIELRNELTNQLSTSLQKQSLLNSIVVHMSRIIQADRGFIYLLNGDGYSTFGISEPGVRQFKENIQSGLHQRLLIHKQAFVIKRELQADEKGYHEESSYCYDVYLPIILSNQEVAAIMVLSRFSGGFSESELTEYEAMARQIGNSLEKVSIYEHSEEARIRNQAILDTTKEAIQLVDLDGQVLLVNRSFCELIDCKSGTEHIVGANFHEWSHMIEEKLVDREGFHRFIHTAQARDESVDSKVFVFTKKQTGQVIKVYSKPLYRNQVLEGTIFVYRDITKEYEVDKMKSEFVSTVSHELRTPLASILGFTELLLHRKLSIEKQTKYVTTVHQEAQRLTKLVNDFLDVQKMEAGLMNYQESEFHLLDVMRRVVELMKGTSAQHQLIIVAKTSEDLWRGDEVKIEQVLTNLVSNAMKYSPNGGKVEVSLTKKDDRYLLSVKDEGLGIPQESVGKIFDKFYRVDNSDRRKIGGTGLGLAIVQEIVRSHGGNISVQSEYGKGSIFTIELPIRERV